ncbi:unnamed protein product [Calypogeia fissa]
MAALPLDPSLARALLAAEELGCLDQALTMAAMLSYESIFFQPPRYIRHHPEWVLYHELIATSHPLVRHVWLRVPGCSQSWPSWINLTLWCSVGKM